MNKKRQRHNKIWTEEDISILSELWGSISVPAIARKLQRTVSSVSHKASNLGLGTFTFNGSYISFNQLMLAFGFSSCAYSSIKHTWIDLNSMPVKKIKVINSSVLVVDIDKFWKWAEVHRNLLKFTRLEPLSLGAEPSWVDEQRTVERKSHLFNFNIPWSDYDIERLKFYVRKKSYNLEELSSIFGRSEESLSIKIKDLGLSLAKLRRPIHYYTVEEFNTICEFIKSGYSIADIAQIMLIPQHNLRDYIFRKFGTSNVDKIYKILKGEGK